MKSANWPARVQKSGTPPGKPGDVKHSRADITRLRETGFSAKTDFLSALRATVEHFQLPEK